MNPFIWIVIIVFVLIWIVNNFLRSAQEERTANRRRLSGEGQTASQGTRRPKTEIEQFLEEVNRRRRQKDSRQAPAEEQQPPMRTPVATRPARQPAGEVRRSRPATRPGRTMPEREPQRPMAVEEAVVVETASRPEVGQGTLGQMTPVAGAPPAPAPATLVADEIRVTPLNELTTLLRSTEGMRVAMILQEVLAPPRCRRPYRS
ncbi:MAG TPA: hypothetical protein VGY58_14450 [Gemmataceae bacterium]|jgi:hypothetical protein|nr:hypothetical protein [Gemmataceae bacterium]